MLAFSHRSPYIRKDVNTLPTFWIVKYVLLLDLKLEAVHEIAASFLCSFIQLSKLFSSDKCNSWMGNNCDTLFAIFQIMTFQYLRSLAKVELTLAGIMFPTIIKTTMMVRYEPFNSSFEYVLFKIM